MTAALVLAAAVAIAAILTGVIRRYALARSILDIPNERSSHAVPTPRGGGLAIAAVTLGGSALLGISGALDARVALALVAGGALVALVGWVDDRRGLSQLARVASHFVAAAIALVCLAGLPQLELGRATLELGAFGWPVALLGIVWLLNLFNFMDGIDGIAGIEGATVGIYGALMLAGAPGLGLVAVLIAGACAGFLVWNWQPARIFMGDVGSGLLGYLFGVLAVASENAGAVPLLGWVILLGAFLVDATLTLVRRAVRGERWYAAHRSHAYQRAVQSGLSHGRVSLAFGVVNSLLFLLIVASGRDGLPAAAAGALAGLLLLYLWVERRRPMWNGPKSDGAGRQTMETGTLEPRNR